ncbi:MAG: SUMF1/EgtB/PvdO family nonheme iron enzyme [Lachnospiraceae bacterium]|nr:SUMF1/EgtB/PvdO family nonheme iron enzyme [Lachnospiraceae bacterium]
MSNFDLTDLAVQMICPGNKVILDEKGMPSVMVYIPKFKNNDVLAGGDSAIHPAFVVDGVGTIDGFYYSKYLNCIHDGCAYSLPGQDPANTINFDNSRARCEAKGNGWHLSTAAEWAAIALWCKANGFMPYGNNNYGKDSRESNYRAIPSCPLDSSNRVQRTATGTGPVSWNHDKSLAGIADLNGNVNEWQGGIRLVWGELQILANNDAADPDNPQNNTSTAWKAIDAATGALVTPECSVSDAGQTVSGNTVKLDWRSSAWVYSTAINNPQSSYQGCLFGNITADATIGTAAVLLLRCLALLPDQGAVAADYEGDYVYWNHNVSERCVFRGGGWNGGTSAGLFYLGGSSDRTIAGGSLGFRSAYIPEIS